MSLIPKLGLWTWAKIAGLAGGAAYVASAAEEDPEKRTFKNAVDKNVIPALGNIGSKAMAGVGNIVEDLTGSDAAKKGIQTATTATETGLTTLPGMAATAIPQAAGAVGGVVSSGVEVGQNTVGSFMDKLDFIPEGWKGIAKWGAMAAATVLGGFGLSKATGFSAGEKLFSTALNFPMTALTAVGSAAMTALTPVLYIGTALTAGWLLLTENGRGVISSVYEGIKSLAPSGSKTPAAEHSHAPAPAAAPAAVPAPMPNVSGLNLDGITGGTSTHTVSLNRDQLPANPRLNTAESHLATGA